MRIRLLRNEFGYTQEELGKKVGQTKSNISKYETGALEPGIDTLRQLSEVFNVSLDYLTGKSDIRNPYNENSKEKYPKSTELIEYLIKEAEKEGYNIKDKSKEELAEIIVKALKIDEITKSN